MKGLLIVVFAVIAAVVAQNDVYGTPVNFGAYQGINTQLGFGVGNNGSSQITSVSYTVSASPSSGIYFSYPGGATKSTIGNVNAGSVGSGYFYVVGLAGTYALTYAVSYKRSGVSYSKNVAGSIQIVEQGGDGKRDTELQIDYSSWSAEYDSPVELDVNAKRGNDVALTPSAFGAFNGITTWTKFKISASHTVRDITYGVAPSTNSILINYPASGNTLPGTISAGSSKDAQFAITGTTGTYSLYIAVQYKKATGNTLYYEYLDASLVISGFDDGKREIEIQLGERSATEEISVRSIDGGMKTEYVVGFGVGIALLAGVAVGIALFALKRNSTPNMA